VTDRTERPSQPENDATRTTGGGGPAFAGTDRIPVAIGQYRILGKLGEGGMGVVYEAEQQQPRRKVALKVVRGGHFVDEQRIKMFQREADTLARLKHPNIGAIYESGRTEDGQHFFAMELVRGDTLDAYSNKRPRRLDASELGRRLGLFRKITDAVHYAHQRGVIHRDLKPSNIVVVESASEDIPEIKILDFGLARITEGDLTASTMTTEVGVIKGTLPYMSPEQARGNPEAIDLRTDVYALGVILYELLAGARPYDVHERSLIDAVQVICETPPRPLRQSWSGVRRLDSDIETIVGMALEKEPDRRYASAAALSEDIERFLRSQPILAVPPSTIYQLRKLVSRNKVPAACGVALLLSIIGFGVWMSVLYHRSETNLERALEAEARATEEAATATQVSDFLTGLFAVSDPSEAKGNAITVREVLDDGSQKIRDELKEQPVIRARLLTTMGQVYRSLGLYEPAKALLGQALETRRQTLGTEHRDVADSMHRLASVHLISGEYDVAEPLLLETLRLRRELLGDEDPQVADTQSEIAALLHDVGKYETAEAMYRETLALDRKLLGEKHEYVAIDLNNLASLLQEVGRYHEAEPLFRQSLAMRRRLNGEEHVTVARALGNLGTLLRDKGDLDAAEPLLLQALEIWRKFVDEDHPEIAMTLFNIAQMKRSRGDFVGAEPLYRQVIEVMRKTFPEGHLKRADALAGLGSLLVDRGDYLQAEPLLRDAAVMMRDRMPEGHWRTALAESELGACLVGLQRYAEAEPLLVLGYEGVKAKLGKLDHRTARTVEHLVQLYEAWPRHETAARYRAIIDGMNAL
jgi:serine/threonine protein kinase/Tfp pilus assembly protein PilF